MPFALSSMKLTSPNFSASGALERRFSGEGEDISPALEWSDPPAGTRAFAVICHDPDAPLFSANGTYGFVHWVLYNLPATTTALEEGTDLGTAGIQDGGKTGYGGPMPPEGHGVHRYYFWVLALDSDRSFAPGLTLWEFLAQAEPHILGANRLVGTYQRS